jgi:hypothetical protein
MINPIHFDKIKIAQSKLDSACPSNDQTLISLSRLFSSDILKWNKKDATAAKAIVEIDDLINQLRWHYGQALLIKEIYPAIQKYDMANSPKHPYMPAQIMLQLRELINYPNKVVFEDYETNWFGGTAAGWIFHMMIDDAMIRLIAAFDRVALLLFGVADIKNQRIYFRSGKLELLHKKLNFEETQRLVNISSSKEFIKYFISYRDNIVHNKNAFSRMAGSIPIESYFENGELKNNYEFYWDTEILPNLVNAGYKILSDVLVLTNSICSKIRTAAS